MDEQNKYEETCGCEHHHGEGEDCGCGHHHEDGEDCGCGHHHEDGESCGCGHHHHHGGQKEQHTQDAPYTVQGQMLGTSVVATSTVTVMTKYTEIEDLAKKELQGLADWVTGQNGTIVQMKSALVAIHSTMMVMTEDGKKLDTIVPDQEEIRTQFVTMVNNVPLEALKDHLKEICERILQSAQ